VHVVAEATLSDFDVGRTGRQNNDVVVARKALVVFSCRKNARGRINTMRSEAKRKSGAWRSSSTVAMRRTPVGRRLTAT